MSQRIRFGEPVEMELPEEELPSEELLINDPGVRQRRSESFQVYILDDVFEEIWRHLQASSNRETGGLLVGHPFRALGNRQISFIVIVGAVRQDSDNRSVGHYTVNPSEIAIARSQIEEKYPGLTVVGWYHSHPGHGVFLSAQDMTIVRSIYNAEWQVALVVDPQREKAGFFRGSEGQRLPGWLELEKEPDIVNAIAKYNQAKEILAQRPEQARDLLITLDRMVNRPGMAHWQIKGGYRDVKALLSQMFNSDTSDLSNQNVSHFTSRGEASIDNQEDHLGIHTRYSEAKNLFHSAVKGEYPNQDRLRQAQQIFKWVELKLPGYEDVNIFMDVIDKVLALLESNRPSRNVSIKDEIQRIIDEFGEKLLGKSNQNRGSQYKQPTNSPVAEYEQRKSQRPETGKIIDQKT